MRINRQSHLSYCTNIHPGETWNEVFSTLQRHVPVIKSKITDQPFGLGLRLSARAAEELTREGTAKFKEWLQQHDLYIFTMNGFPYGGFHHQKVKDQVHYPDWTSSERLAYTLKLFALLADLLPDNLPGGISTSPLSYRPWYTSNSLTDIMLGATHNLIEVVEKLDQYYQEAGVEMHLDLEPEPDGILENSQQTLQYFKEWLLPTGIKTLSRNKGITSGEAEEMILKYITICYDVCHFAVVYEEPAVVLEKFQAAGINIGKIQLSAALKKEFTGEQSMKDIQKHFSSLDEPTYLHQVVGRKPNGELDSFTDLAPALLCLEDGIYKEWRTHFHVPVFEKNYGLLQSTQQDIIETLKLWAKGGVSNHLEVETYTWEVLPKDLRTDLDHSIVRELQWVKDIIGRNNA